MRTEFELIELLRERIAAAGAGSGERIVVPSGDDAAVTVPGGATATSVDAIVDGVHFRRSTHPPDAIGTKALAVAVSDLAAMGAAPGEAYVQLGLPEDLTEDELAGIADGIGAAAAMSGVVVAGGDVVASPVLFLALTVVGHAPGAASFVTRAGARPGDALVLVGRLGGASAGLALLEQPGLRDAVGGVEADALIERQMRPRALVEAGRALAASGAGAMIDVSDGLGADAGHIARSSSVRLEIDLPAEAICAGVEAVAEATGRDPLVLTVNGGEDYALLAAVPEARLRAALEAVLRTGDDPAVVGRVEAGEGVVLRSPTGREALAEGFDQVRSRARGGPT
ncbi:MAG: thiamine-phosphate kinase [Actinomycetota bacterium]|nr:thiamine-phosphate kinase [Actinomycetota bacterium]